MVGDTAHRSSCEVEAEGDRGATRRAARGVVRQQKGMVSWSVGQGTWVVSRISLMCEKHK